jgi:hypothetical protein
VAWFRLPGAGWLELQARADAHPLWGACDALRHHPGAPRAGAGERVGLLAALDYAALRWLPPFERPAALPPGAGAAVLNFLALLARAQGKVTLAYRGPFPTPALFASLCRSFVPEGDPPQAQARFSEHQTALALRGELVESPVRWRPAPFAALRPRPELLLHLRDGVETAWVGTVPFRRAVPPAMSRVAPHGGALPSGARVWPAEGGWAVGLVLLGRPYALLYKLGLDGAVLQAAPLEAEPEPDPAEPGAPLDPRWLPVLGAWVTLQAHPALAAAASALQGELTGVWRALPLRMAALRDATLSLQAALAGEFLRRRTEEDAGALAMMLVSDVLEAAAPLLLQRAQRLLEAAPRSDPQALLAAGRQAQAQARAQLERALPALVGALARGEALPEV